MTTFAFIHGAGDVGWYWHLVEAELRARGHQTVAPDLPVEEDTAGLGAYADTVLEAVGDSGDLAVVAQSFGGYVAPLVADRIGARVIVLVAGMVPSHAESAEEMFANTGWQPESFDDNSTLAIFYHDVPPELAQEALRRGRRQSDTPGREAWPLSAWPPVPTRFLLCRLDRLFPAAWLRRVVRVRLGIVPDEIDSGHCPALSQPHELAAYLTEATHQGGRTEIGPPSLRHSRRRGIVTDPPASDSRSGC
jgi:Alpha/beta hydrolase family